LTVSRAFWVVGTVCAIAVVGWLWSDRDFFEPQISQSIADFKKNWLIGKWVFASGLVWAISMNLYPWILAAFHGVASTGLWAASLGVVSIGSPVVMGIQNLIGPKVAHVYAENGHSALRRFVFKVTELVAVPISLFCLILFIWGNRLIALLYGRQYLGNSLTIAILALNVLVTALAFSFSRALFAVDRADLDFLVNFTALFVMLTLGLWLVRAFGPLGAAFGLLGANFATSAVRVVLFLRLPPRLSREQAAV
jgi:O-antigen/teichoic acid export membrane protein